jgi:hypothetical protein
MPRYKSSSHGGNVASSFMALFGGFEGLHPWKELHQIRRFSTAKQWGCYQLSLNTNHAYH